MKKYLNRVFISISILINTLLGGRNNQTFSARNWERKRNNKINLVFLIDFLWIWEKNHCLESWSKWEIINHAINRYENSNNIEQSKRSNWYEKDVE
jgi:hypothetical protein